CSSDDFLRRNQRKRNLLRARALQQRLPGRRRAACAANRCGLNGTSGLRLATGSEGPPSGLGPTFSASASQEVNVAGQREAHELLLIEEADAWFESLEATRAQSPLRYKEVEPWAWARLTQRLRAIKTRRAKVTRATQ